MSAGMLRCLISTWECFTLPSVTCIDSTTIPPAPRPGHPLLIEGLLGAAQHQLELGSVGNVHYSCPTVSEHVDAPIPDLWRICVCPDAPFRCHVQQDS